MRPYKRNPKLATLKSTAAGKQNKSAAATESEITKLRYLNAAIAEAEAQIVNCRNEIESEQQLLDSILAGERDGSITNKKYIEAGKNACRTGMNAWELSIKAYQADIDTFQADLDLIAQRIPKGFSN